MTTIHFPQTGMVSNKPNQEQSTSAFVQKSVSVGNVTFTRVNVHLVQPKKAGDRNASSANEEITAEEEAKFYKKALKTSLV